MKLITDQLIVARLQTKSGSLNFTLDKFHIRNYTGFEEITDSAEALDAKNPPKNWRWKKAE